MSLNPDTVRNKGNRKSWQHSWRFNNYTGLAWARRGLQWGINRQFHYNYRHRIHNIRHTGDGRHGGWWKCGNHETMNVKIRTNTWAGFRFSKHEILLRCIQAAEAEDYPIIVRASHHSSHLIKDIKSRDTGPGSTRVPASPASHTSLDIGGLSHLVSCKHLLPGSHLYSVL